MAYHFLQIIHAWRTRIHTLSIFFWTCHMVLFLKATILRLLIVGHFFGLL